MKKFLVYLLGCLMVLSGCGEDGAPKGGDQEYFPLQTGFYQVYSVEKTSYSELNPPVSSIYELKTEVIDSFVNQEGENTYVIHLSTRVNEGEPWQFQEVWSARINQYQAVMTEGNVSYVRISFPARRNKEWNGNALNSLEEDVYHIDGAGVPYELNTEFQFDNAVIITQHDELTALRRDQREEIYARKVGLIYKKSSVLNYCDDVSCFGQQIIKDGEEYVQVLMAYGQN